jgi:Trypsin-co-occurring domain 2
MRNCVVTKPQSRWITVPEDRSVDLGEALEALREVLADSWEGSRDEAIRFRVSEIKLTVQSVVGREGSFGAKLRWWLLEAGAEGKTTSQSVQTLVLTLQPQVHGVGPPMPLDVDDRQDEPVD